MAIFTECYVLPSRKWCTCIFRSSNKLRFSENRGANLKAREQFEHNLNHDGIFPKNQKKNGFQGLCPKRLPLGKKDTLRHTGWKGGSETRSPFWPRSCTTEINSLYHTCVILVHKLHACFKKKWDILLIRLHILRKSGCKFEGSWRIRAQDLQFAASFMRFSNLLASLPDFSRGHASHIQRSSEKSVVVLKPPKDSSKKHAPPLLSCRGGLGEAPYNNLHSNQHGLLHVQ